MLELPGYQTKDVNHSELCCLFLINCNDVLFFTIIPQTAEKIWKILGYENSLALENWQKAFDLPLKSGFAILEPKVLFQKIEDEDIQKEQTMLQKEPEKTITPIKDPISFEQFSALDLRVGKILEVEKVPKSKKLLYLSVDIGSETRKVVSGIANAFEPTEILGKKILFVATKKQAKDIVAQAAESVNMPHVTDRWLGGMMTNFSTIRKSVKKMNNIARMLADGSLSSITKKERLTLTRERNKLDKVLGGIANINRLPQAIFVVDISHEHIAIAESKKLGLQTFAIVDTAIAICSYELWSQ